MIRKISAVLAACMVLFLTVVGNVSAAEPDGGGAADIMEQAGRIDNLFFGRNSLFQRQNPCKTGHVKKMLRRVAAELPFFLPGAQLLKTAPIDFMLPDSVYAVHD